MTKISKETFHAYRKNTAESEFDALDMINASRFKAMARRQHGRTTYDELDKSGMRMTAAGAHAAGIVEGADDYIQYLDSRVL